MTNGSRPSSPVPTLSPQVGGLRNIPMLIMITRVTMIPIFIIIVVFIYNESTAVVV
jgi:hypothetical protein